MLLLFRLRLLRQYAMPFSCCRHTYAAADIFFAFRFFVDIIDLRYFIFCCLLPPQMSFIVIFRHHMLPLFFADATTWPDFATLYARCCWLRFITRLCCACLLFDDITPILLLYYACFRLMRAMPDADYRRRAAP